MHAYSRSFLPVLFFFSSRRRHTRSKRDWSSDVCSSDLSPDPKRRISHWRNRLPAWHGAAPDSFFHTWIWAFHIFYCMKSYLPLRSEERRVGKEVRSRR